jgi:beta-fructofuranosidase
MRPRFHFTAPRGWINDPHGVTIVDGRYHLFYQYVPESLQWQSNCHWGHATSADLFDFEHLPVALAPGSGDDGIWSGSIAGGTAFYTSVVEPEIGIGRIRSATPTDGSWRTWAKGPIVATAPPELDVVAFRDPFVFPHGGGWRMLVGAALVGGTAAALSYRSETLASWEYEGIAAQRSSALTEPVWTGALWECPQLFEVEGRHVMVTSVWEADVLHHVAYAVGSYEGATFTPVSWGRLSYGPSYYAPSFFRDAAGAPTFVFWLRGVADPAEGWAGAHSIPHTLSLRGDVLVAQPHPDLARYHRDAAQGGLAADITWSGGSELAIVSGRQVAATVSVDGTVLVLSVDDGEWTMPHDGGDVRLVVDGPTLEISTRSGLLAAAISPAGDSLDVECDGHAVIHGLAR